MRLPCVDALKSPLKPVDEKVINSRSKKEIENCIRANLRIITRETVSQKAVRTAPPVRGHGTVRYSCETKGYTSDEV